MEQQQNKKKICKHCDGEFVEKHFGVFEHRYCSAKCRNTRNNIMRRDKFKQLENRYKIEEPKQIKISKEELKEFFALCFFYGLKISKRKISEKDTEIAKEASEQIFLLLLNTCKILENEQSK